jgi:predicted glycogen debranching enzyme
VTQVRRADGEYGYGPGVLGHLDHAASLEWLVPDGLGGYAMGTAPGLRTRRYHGLLVVATPSPARRMMGLASLDPIVTKDTSQVRLYTHQWSSGVVDPAGHARLVSFTVTDGLPCWRWRVGDVVLERRIGMEHGAPVVAVTHTLLAGGPVELVVEPLCTWRDAHGERHARAGLRVEPTADGVVVEGAYRVAGPGFEFDPAWYEGVFHREEAARELAATEDLLRAGRFRQRLQTGDSLDIVAWAGDLDRTPAPALTVIDVRARRHRGLVAAGGPLAAAADAFVVRTPTGPDVVAGYPWFGVWSRDTMISYEGMFLTTGRFDEGRDLLQAYAGTLSEGMLANTADTGRTEYNTADATLWFVHAIDRHLTITGDTDLAAALRPALDEVVRAHRAGTRYGIRIDGDGLLTQGAPGKALTWMDAVVGGAPVTPRRGKAVELNALWINALAALGHLRERLGADRTECDQLRARAVAAFRARFPSGHGWLYDTVDAGAEPAGAAAEASTVNIATVDGGAGDGSGTSAALRPNQLLAYGLPHAPLRADPGAAAVVAAVGRALLTPLGLRSLAPGEPGYRGAHRGGVWARDHAYHQGTVWPWLIGPYVDAARAVGQPIDGVLDGLLAHLAEYGIGSVSETADGDPPHGATGCPFQAWSVAELLRAHRLSTPDTSAP